MLTQEELKRRALARAKRGRIISEAKLQSECVLWWKNTYPERRGSLFAVFNEGKDVTHKLSVGLTPGVCDLLYVDKDCGLWGFELKQKGTSHNVEHLRVQARWMMQYLPGRAWFCDSLEAFQKAMLGDRSGCIEPRRVYDFCSKCRGTSVLWDKVVEG